MQLQIRVIAVENPLIALLAQADDAQLDLICDMAPYISPRPGFTPHPLTVGAAGEMISLVERSNHSAEQRSLECTVRRYVNLHPRLTRKSHRRPHRGTSFA